MFRLFFYTTSSERQPVSEFVENEDKKAQIKIREVLTFLKEYGFRLPYQYLRRMSGTKELWELRTKHQGRQYRIFIAKYNDNSAILLHAIIKKTQKTPLKDIQIAINRLQMVLLAKKGKK